MIFIKHLGLQCFWMDFRYYIKQYISSSNFSGNHKINSHDEMSEQPFISYLSMHLLNYMCFYFILLFHFWDSSNLVYSILLVLIPAKLSELSYPKRLTEITLICRNNITCNIPKCCFNMTKFLDGWLWNYCFFIAV